MVQIQTEEIKRHIIEIIKELIDTPDDNAVFVEAVRNSLSRIVEKYTTKEYTFNISMEYFIGRAPSNCYDALASILEKDIVENDGLYDDGDNLDVAFAAYYALSLIFKKQNEYKKLEELASDKYNCLDCHPLRFEVKARYFKRIGEYEEALNNDDLAINILESMGVVNQAVGISYASTVCSILENSRTQLNEEVIERARKHIEDAIAINPQYPKYHFLKAKLLFYSIPRDASEEEIISIIKEAKDCIIKAEVALYGTHYGKSKFKTTEQKAYSEFKKRLGDTLERRKVPMFPQKNEELDQLKQEFLKSESQDFCVTSSALPPVPKLKTGDKYFFVCYSSRDFKSVYCDLIELYKHKVPFRYDEHLTHGIGWKEQIERYMSDSDCVGVVFYLSKNILSTHSVSEEIDLVTKYNKRHFCVNLEGNLAPSKILIQIIIDACASLDPEKYPLSGEVLRKYLNFFKDEEVFTCKFKNESDAGTAHLKSYIDDIQRSFPSIIIG